jgi:glutathione S-transferase
LRMLESPAAAHEMLPPGPAKLLSPRVALLGMRAFNLKYGITEQQRASYDATIRSELYHLREALAGGRRYLFERLTYADFAMAIALSALGPVPETPHGPAARAVMTDLALAAEFADLTAWRDSFHARHPLI